MPWPSQSPGCDGHFSYAKFVIAITFVTSIREHSEPVRKTGPTPGPTSLSLGRRSYSAVVAIFIARQTDAPGKRKLRVRIWRNLHLARRDRLNTLWPAAEFLAPYPKFFPAR